MHESSKRVVLGGLLLAFMASAVNVQFLLTLGASVSHLTGDVARISADSLMRPKGWLKDVTALSMVLLGFVIGAACSGYFIHHPNLSLDRPYGRSVSLIGATLILANFVQQQNPVLASFLAAGGCGAQNALATRYRGMVLRTTHVSGLLTDLGQMMGMRLAGQLVENWRFFIHAGLILAFVAGAMGGAALHLSAVKAPLVWLGMAYVAGGLTWSVHKRWKTREGH